MGKTIQVEKKISRSDLDKKITELGANRKPVDLKKFFGKINFKVDGLTYQLKSRDEWR